MAQQKLTKEYNTFIRGIITEASPLTFPENASIDEANFDLKRDGSRKRRLGIDYETNYTLHDTGDTATDIENYAIGSFLWKNVSDDATISFAVVQFGTTLYIFNETGANISSSFVDTVDFTSKKTASSPTIGQSLVSADSGNGVLFITSKEVDPFYIKYDPLTTSFTMVDIGIKVRDFFGVQDGLGVSTRPTSLSNLHKYNLYNQGWPTSAYCGKVLPNGTVSTTPAQRDPLAFTFTEIGGYPSNADILSLGRRDATSSASDVYESFYQPDTMEKFSLYNTPAASGHFVIDAFDRGASRATESGIPVGTFTDIEAGRPSAVAFFSGRVFYAGVESSTTTDSNTTKVTYNGFIFFSQVLDSLEKVGKCYQEADPTDEGDSSLVQTDGGTIVIPDAKRILKLVAKQNSLVVIADNGIWEITGGDVGFNATDFQVSKVTNIGAISTGSIINAEGNIVYWGEGGIYALQADQVSLQLSASNISETTIQTLYNDISNTAKINCTSAFNPSDRKLRWLYNDDETYLGVKNRYKYNKELILDTVLNAFTINTIADSNPYIAGYITTSAFQTENDTQTIVVGSDTVQASAVDVVTTNQITVGDDIKTKFLVLVDDTTIKGTIAEYNSTTFLDWYTYDSTGTDYLSYLVTGYELVGDTMRDKQSPYLVAHLTRTEEGLDINSNPIRPSSCKIQTRWGWSDSATSGQWGTEFQAYRYKRNYIISGSGDSLDYGYSVITTKNRLRGSGPALSLYIHSESGYDLQLLGWGLVLEGRSIV